jgi:hypothetical protein
MSARLDLTGLETHCWTVLGPAAPPSDRSPRYAKQTWWRCECICGTIKPVPAQSLSSGTSRSCGCLRDAANRRRAHVACVA